MGLIDRIFNNPTMQEAAFGAIRKMLKEGGHTHVILALKPDDTFDIQMLQGEPVIFSKETSNEMADTFDRISKELRAGKELSEQAAETIKALRTEASNLSNMCVEQERAIIQYRNRIGELEMYIENAARHGTDVYELPLINPVNPDNGNYNTDTAEGR